MGGNYDDKTTTFIPFDGEPKRAFELEVPAYGHCAIDYTFKNSSSVILLGGYDYINKTSTYLSNVTRYNGNGFMESLPNMNYRRMYLSCAGYYDDNNVVSLNVLIIKETN